MNQYINWHLITTRYIFDMKTKNTKAYLEWHIYTSTHISLRCHIQLISESYNFHFFILFPISFVCDCSSTSNLAWFLSFVEKELMLICTVMHVQFVATCETFTLLWEIVPREEVGSDLQPTQTHQHDRLDQELVAM